MAGSYPVMIGFNAVFLRVAVAFAPAILVGCSGRVESAFPEEAETSFVMIDAGDADRAWDTLGQINAKLSAEARKRVATQGHYDATDRVRIEFVGDCKSQASFVDEVRRLAEAAGTRDVVCTGTVSTPANGD